jgi:hypothetical protein
VHRLTSQLSFVSRVMVDVESEAKHLLLSPPRRRASPIIGKRYFLLDADGGRVVESAEAVVLFFEMELSADGSESRPYRTEGEAAQKSENCKTKPNPVAVKN